MWARAWCPAVCDESPKRGGEKGDREGFEGGTHAEPGHRQKVRIFASPGPGLEFYAEWMTAIYDRIACEFWVKYVSVVNGKRVKVWGKITRDILAWTQYPLNADFVDPEVCGYAGC